MKRNTFAESCGRKSPETARRVVEYLPPRRGRDLPRQVSKSHEHNKHYYADFHEGPFQFIFMVYRRGEYSTTGFSLIHRKEIRL